MANALQLKTLNEITTQYAQLNGLPPHKAFLYFVIERFLQKLELNSIDIEESIVDGSDDCGIDAIVIDEDSEFRPRIYFFQSKYYQTEDAFNKQFEGNALEKIQGAISDFVLQGRINPKYQNSRLVDKLHSVKNLSSKNPYYTIVFCSNSLEPSDTAKARIEEFKTETNKSSKDEYISVEYVHLDRITQELVAPPQQSRVDVRIQVSGRYLTEETGNARLFVGAVEAQDLASLVEEHGDDLFESNVRGYLRQANQVNKSIMKTASGDKSPYFVYMNNGLTITCDRFSHAPIQNSPVLDVSNAQIVNGQQTARSVHTAFKTKKLKPDVKVLVRIVETTDRDLLMEIVEATNSQTKVTSRDLHSNDEIQKLIESHLKTKGYFYEARKNKYKGKDTTKRVDAELAAQSYFAVLSEQPAAAKDKKKLLFGDKYEEIFHDEINPDDFLFSFRLIRAVQKLNNEKDFENYTFLKDATLHTAALIHRYTLHNEVALDLENIESIKGHYAKAIEALSKLVQERSEEEKDKYEHRRTFKDPETYGRAVEILLK